ncbi:MAG: patatin-like phospholipase family protein [Clostridia bacterium]|nr:patatin-like phospholipase family protein [Clostridia bacterium]
MKNDRNSFKIGLALGSGGAKGLAHLGALKAFEEEGIAFDIIAGTSIGSIVGALYAKGYSSDDMRSLLRETVVGDVQTVLMFALGTVSLTDIINKFTGGAHFSDLKKPFKAVAVDMDEGKEVVIDSGDLAVALSASSAVPPFPPIRVQGKRLVDGAFLNYVPSDVVKEMGADCVIAINLGKGRDTNQAIKRALDEFCPDNNVPLSDRASKCYEHSDFVLEPNLEGFSSSALRGFDEMYEIGYSAAKEKMQEIKEIISNKRKG